ncbi:cyclic di-GMP phosphodiesterase [Yokenella regensburgei]|uniref:cyclic di-GMP phosphodiesterase n=1 Tax=Yokenella regensburgei TaxID=158877 RepID=UPI003F18AA65
MFTRNVTATRKILLLSILAGFLAAMIVGGAQFLILQNKHEEKLDEMVGGIQHWLVDYLSDIRNTAESLQPLTLNECREVASELTSRAAFTLNVRAFLLIKGDRAICSSATGVMNSSMRDLVPEIDLEKDEDMALLPGTPMMPGKPSVVMWFRSPLLDGRGVFASLNINLAPFLLYSPQQQELNGIALGIGNNAISTFSPGLIDLQSLPAPPFRVAPLPGLPLTIYLYAKKWKAEDIQFATLFGVVSGIVAGMLAAYVLSIHLRPGKEILTAIKRDQFYVVYQPVLDATDLKVRGAEALMRWKHPTAGEIPADAFIQFAEAQKLIVPLTLHLFKLIARDAATLQTLLPEGAKLGVNIAPGHLHASTFKDDIRAFSHALPADYFSLVLEITERDMLHEAEAATLFQWLHNEGYEIAIDDFGTGHSALIYLERFTLDYLKIDRGFVNAIGTETVTSPVLDAVLTLAKRLNMATVAEGVETPEQARWLREHGVHFLQGYYFSRPMTLAQFMAWQPAPFSSRL